MTKSIYQKRGYKDRFAYLRGLASDYCVPTEIVFCLADMLGPSEDFDGLINELEDYSGGY